MKTENEIWDKQLAEGEVLLWSGKPEGVRILNTSRIGITLLLWCAAAAAFVFSLMVILPKSIEAGDKGVHLVMIMVLMECVPLLMFMLPIMDCRILQGSTWYAVTNHRVMMKNRERTWSMLRNPSFRTEYRRRKDGRGHVLIGECTGKADSRLRALAIQPPETNRSVNGLVFYHIDQAEQVVKILNE